MVSMFLLFDQRDLAMIFQPSSAVAAIERIQHQTVLAVCPLQSIIDDKIAVARIMGMSAASIADVADEELSFQHNFSFCLAQPKKLIWTTMVFLTFSTQRSAYATKLSKHLTAIPNP